GARSHLGVHLLPARAARGDRARYHPLQRVQLPDRDEVPRAARRLPGGGVPDPVRRSAGREVEDVAQDLRRGVDEGVVDAVRGLSMGGKAWIEGQVVDAEAAR